MILAFLLQSAILVGGGGTQAIANPVVPSVGPMDHIYVQTVSNDGVVTNNNDYPQLTIPGGVVRAQFQPIYEMDHIGSWSSDGSYTTFTLSSGTTHLNAGDGFVIETPDENSDIFCVVSSVPTSTSFIFRNFNCDAQASYMDSGSGTFSAGSIVEKKEGPSMNPKGKYEVINTGTVAAKYFIESVDHQRISKVGCNADLHSAACYETNPVLDNEWPFGALVHIDPATLPACSQTGRIQDHNMVPVSTAQFSVKFTSSQDPSKSNIRNYLVCAPGAGSGHNVVPTLNPFYDWSYTNEQHVMIAENFSNADKYGFVTITSDDGTGDATIETFPAPASDGFVQHTGAVKPEFVFHSGTKKDGYTVTWCADSDQTQCKSSRWYVDTQAKPPNFDHVAQKPCGVDPVMAAAGGQTYDIGPGQTITRLQDAPTQNYPWGSTFIIHYGTYKEYWQFGAASNASAHANDFTVPMIHICGLADPTTGELPVEDGDKATANINVNHYIGEGNLLTFYGSVSTPNYDPYTGKVQGSHGILITGIKFLHDNNTYQHYVPGDPGTGTLYPYEDGEAVRVLAAQGYTVAGNRTILIANPYFDNGNWNGGYQRFASVDGWWEGNRCESYGTDGASTEHCYYMQGWRDHVIGALEEGTLPGDQGTGFFSFRPVKSFYLYGRGYPNVAAGYGSGSQLGGGSEKQDNSRYFSLDYAFGPTTGYDGDCGDGNGFYPLAKCNNGEGPVFGGMDTIAGLAEESWTSFFVMGSAFSANGGNCDIGIEQTHSDNGLEVGHNLYLVNNTIDCAKYNGGGISLFEGSRFQNGGHIADLMMIDWPMAEVYNSMFWWNDNSTCANYGSYNSVRPVDKLNFYTNIVHPGQFNPTVTGIQQAYGGDGFGSCFQGLNRSSMAVQPTGMNPVEARAGGWSPSNFIMPSTQPYDSTTLAPTAAEALNSATVPHYPTSLYPIIFNAADANDQLTRRIQVDGSNFPTTIGSADGR